MQQYFSYIPVCYGTEKKLDLGWSPNAIDISQGSLSCPSKNQHGTNLFTVIPRNCPISVAFNNVHGDTGGGGKIRVTQGAETDINFVFVIFCLVHNFLDMKKKIT